MNNNIVLLTSGQPSLNPRLVKEADALAEAGCAVTVIYQYWNDWGTELDLQLLATKTWKAVRVGGSPKQHKLAYWVSRMQHKLATLMIKQFGFRFNLAEKAAGRCTFLLLKEALQHKADLYIAHNLAALAVAILAAKKTGAKCGFDAEDFHRNEISDDQNNVDVKLKTYLENKYFPQLDYLTASSFPITELYQDIFPAKKITTILNVFPVEKRLNLPVLPSDQPLKLFWFSQNIGLNRGLQDIFSALKILENEPIELHILGFLSEPVNKKLQQLILNLKFSIKPDITFYKQINPDELPAFAAQFDIGLALEPAFCINNNAALSNKIFTYLQAGLAIAASDTTAQKQFINQNPALGFCFEKGNGQQLATILKSFLDDPKLLQKTKLAAFEAARNVYNWETESRKFLNVVTETLDN